MAEPPRNRLLRAVRVLVVDPADPDAQALLTAIETVLDEREAEVRAEAIKALAEGALAGYHCNSCDGHSCPDIG